MNLRVRGTDIPESVWAMIGALTNRAQLYFRNVDYDSSSGVLRLPIERLLDQPRRSLVARLKSRPLAWRRSDLIIRQVEACTIQCNLTEEIPQVVTLLFGLGVRGSEIFLSSAEESEGTTCYSVELQVRMVDIEIADEVETFPE